jgi:hypothetical protein
MFRKALLVPMLIDPGDRGCINKHEGICIVAYKGSEHPGDIVFFGPPTVDMEPIDDEATAITMEWRKEWSKNAAFDTFMISGEDYGKSILRMLESQLSDSMRSNKPVSLAGASESSMADLKAMIEAQQRQIQQLINGGVGIPSPVNPAPNFAEDRPAPDVAIPPDPDPDAVPSPPPIHVDRPRSSLRR